MIDPELIAEGRAIDIAATSPPWTAEKLSSGSAQILGYASGPVGFVGSREGGDADVPAVAEAEAIAWMRNNLGALLDALEDTQSALERLAKDRAIELEAIAAKQQRDRQRIAELEAERDKAAEKVARVTAMVDHGYHSEDPDEHDCATHPCWAVILRRALEIGGDDD
jgi:hypothetical protein